MLAAVFPIKAFSLDESVSWLKTVSNHLIFHGGGVTFITNKIWEPLDVVLPGLFTHPGKISNSFFCDCQLNLKLLIFLCREMSNTSQRVDFQCASSPKGHILCVLSGWERDWDGTQAYFSVVSKEIWKFVLNLCAASLCRQLEPWLGLSVLLHFRSLENFTFWLSGFIPF